MLRATQEVIITHGRSCRWRSCDRERPDIRATDVIRSRPRLFLLDGTTLTMPCTPSLLEAYPPSRNQNGESHWPILRLLVAHELHSGIALRPEWGPKSVSEQRLTESYNGCRPGRDNGRPGLRVFRSHGQHSNWIIRSCYESRRCVRNVPLDLHLTAGQT
jgi:hypothetical protein